MFFTTCVKFVFLINKIISQIILFFYLNLQSFTYSLRRFEKNPKAMFCLKNHIILMTSSDRACVLETENHQLWPALEINLVG